MSLAFRGVATGVPGPEQPTVCDTQAHTHDSNRGLGPKMLPKPHRRLNILMSLDESDRTKPHAVCLAMDATLPGSCGIQPQDSRGRP